MGLAIRLVSSSSSAGGGTFEQPRGSKAGNGGKHKPSLIVVEDEILIRLATADFLRENGYRVLEASSADEALAIFAAGEPIELVFADINLPGRMSGTRLAEWIASQFPDVKVLLTTGNPAESEAAGAYGPILLKPYSSDDLLRQIKGLLLG